MKNRLVILLISLSILFSLQLQASVEDDVCGTVAEVGSAPYIPTTGTIKVYVIFAQFKDDPNTDNNGWAKNSYPSWANTFVNSSTGGPYPWNNLSHYFDEMSDGDFQVIGDVYNSLVITDYNESNYSSIGEVNREVILEVDQDPSVDFSEYDNLNGDSPGSDGIVDFIYIIYRNVTIDSLMGYTGIAHLEVSQTINVDGKQIVDNFYIGGGVQQRSGYVGRDYTLYVSAHEMGHYLFGGAHIDYTSNLSLMSGLPVWNASRGMLSWERHHLGWINYTDKTTDGSVTMTDYMTTDQVYRVPIDVDEYFLIENRRHQTTHDKAKDTGFYFYRVTNATSYPPNIDVLCADGNWDFNFNYSTLKISRLTPNPSSTTDEMNVLYQYDSDGNGRSENYACYIPVYHEDAAWGDTEDAFDLTYNNVLSPVSNPSTSNDDSEDFTIEVTGTNTIEFYFTDPEEGKPSKPQMQGIEWFNDHPRITWKTNGESDIQEYKVWKHAEGSTMIAATITHNSNLSTHTWIDYDVDKPGKFDPVYEFSYKVKAVDNTSKESLYSEQVSINGTGGLWKESDDKEKVNNIIKEYSLSQNYPNPFNPTTIIKYQLPEESHVAITLYDMLGREVAELVNKQQAAGHYEFSFDGSELSSGMYIYKITAGSFTASKKLVLVK